MNIIHTQIKDKITDVDGALDVIKSGHTVWIHAGASTPIKLSEGLARRGKDLKEVTIYHLLTFGAAPYVDPEFEGMLRHKALFMGANVRKAVNEGRADYIPIHLHEASKPLLMGQVPVDVALIQVSPPDEHGFCSFGLSVDATLNVCRVAKCIVAEVNAQMPRCLGDSFIHINKLKRIVEVDHPPMELPREPFTEVHKRIGKNISSLIPDGATLQMGIGAIPDAVLHNLGDHKDLGVHTEMFSDGIMELINSGVINGERKTLHPGKVISSFLMGSQTLYHFVDNNALIELHPVEYTNDPFIIAQNDIMVAINSCIQVDLTGQVCSDSIGETFYSGFGGQVDFIRGAAHSKGGVPVIALPSTAKDDTITKIVPRLDLGAGVVTTRADVHWVVTEFGAVNLFGKSVRERAELLISISHPKFREELERAAKARRLF